MKWFILLMLMSGLVQAKGYKCKTAEGKTTYQQSPCRAEENVDGYKFYQESDNTKAELARVREQKEDKRIAQLKLDAEIAEAERLHRIRQYEVIRAESRARSAAAVSIYNEHAAEGNRIKVNYLRSQINKLNKR